MRRFPAIEAYIPALTPFFITDLKEIDEPKSFHDVTLRAAVGTAFC